MALVDETVRLTPRPQGRNWLPCGWCPPVEGEGRVLRNDRAFFAPDREAGERAVAVLGEAGVAATLDYREAEPDWVQVKVGACPAHTPNLELLAWIARFCTGVTVETARLTVPG